MTWEHFEDFARGTFIINSHDNDRHETAWRLSAVYTGKSRVFDGYCIVVDIHGKAFMGRSRGNGCLREALRNVADQVQAAGFQLPVAGLRDDWHESGLSANTGYGYLIEGYSDYESALRRSAHMMEQVA